MHSKRKNIILVDFDVPDKWEFLEALEVATDKKWLVGESISNRNHGSTLQKLIRYAKYFLTPFRVFLHHKEYEWVIGWQQFYGLILAFYFRLFRVKNAPRVIVMTFIYKPKSSFIGGGYERFVRYCVTSDYIQKIIVHSEKERAYYAARFDMPIEKFSYVKLGLEDKTIKIPAKMSKGYYLAPGRSNRDYSFLLSVWDKQLPLKIVCDSIDIQGTKENVEVLRDCYGEDYLNLLSECHAVIIPLKDVHASSGQLVILQAMMYGKPVVVTENDGVKDYIVNGEDGYVIEKRQENLQNAIEQIEEHYSKIATKGRKHYEEKFSLYNEGITIGRIIRGEN